MYSGDACLFSYDDDDVLWFIKVLDGRATSPGRWLMRFPPIGPPFGLRLRTVMGPVCMPLCSS